MNVRDAATWRLRSRAVDTKDHTLIMGIINMTPDSFSDDGAFGAASSSETLAHSAALDHARQLVEEGADIIDVGGESTRPGAAPVALSEELARVIPVVESLAADGVIVSIDTSKPEVASAAVEAGAEIVNDVSGLRNRNMVDVCVELEPGVVIMHMRGEPATMQDDPSYDDVVADVGRYLIGQADEAVRSGVDPNRICLDPGIGFGKTTRHNLELLAGLRRFTGAGYPVLLGVSRKGFLGAILDSAGRVTSPPDRDGASAATAAMAVLAGVAVVRVHNVAATLEATRIADAIVRSASQEF